MDDKDNNDNSNQKEKGRGTKRAVFENMDSQYCVTQEYTFYIFPVFAPPLGRLK